MAEKGGGEMVWTGRRKRWDSMKLGLRLLAAGLLVVPFVVLFYFFVDSCFSTGGLVVKSGETWKLFLPFKRECLDEGSRFKLLAYPMLLWLVFWAVALWGFGWRIFLGATCVWIGKIEGWIFALLVSGLTLFNYARKLEEDKELGCPTLFIAGLVFAGLGCKLIRLWHDKNVWTRLRRAAKRWCRKRGFEMEVFEDGKDRKHCIEISYTGEKNNYERWRIFIVKGFLEVLYTSSNLGEDTRYAKHMGKVAHDLWRSSGNDGNDDDRYVPIIVPWKHGDGASRGLDEADAWRICFPLDKVAREFDAFFGDLGDTCSSLRSKLEKEVNKGENQNEEVKSDSGVDRLEDDLGMNIEEKGEKVMAKNTSNPFKLFFQFVCQKMKRFRRQVPVTLPSLLEAIGANVKHVNGLSISCIDAKRLGDNVRMWAIYVTPQVFAEWGVGIDIAQSRGLLGKSGEGICLVSTDNDGNVIEEAITWISYDYVEEDAKPFADALVENGVVEISI